MGLRSWVAGATCVLSALGLIACSGADTPVRDESGRVVEAGELEALDLRIGDCFTSGGSEVEVVVVVPCADEHLFEVYHVFDLADGRYPGADTIRGQWLQGCLAEFESFVGTTFEESVLDVSGIFPTEQTWNDLGDREVVCSVTPVDGETRVGSARGLAR